jgi:hypothetical protein
MKSELETSDERLDSRVVQCSEASLSVLRSLLGRTIYRMLSPCLQVAGLHIASPSVSIPLTDQEGEGWRHHYAVIRCEWVETANGNDFWQMIVTPESKPAGIEVDAQNGILAPCTINFFGSSQIKQIEIFESNSHPAGFREQGVTYDQAIRFCLEEGKFICVACQLNGPGIATEVSISGDDETIKGFLADSWLRMTLDS